MQPQLPPTILPFPGAEYQTLARQWQGIPGLERAENGRLWAAWYTGAEGEGPNNHVVLVTSGDDGHTWIEPVLAVVPPSLEDRCFDPCLWIDPAGRLWLFWAQSGSGRHYDGRAGVWAIRTENPAAETASWTEPRRICDGVMMNKPTVLSSGEWLLPAAVWSFVKDLDPHPAYPAMSNAVCSVDRGDTWTLRGSADVPERHFDEHMIVERRDGSLWMLVRTKTGIGESRSTDRGYTWSPGQRAPLTGPNSRFFIRRLHSGNLLLVNHLTTGVRANLAALLSKDDGATWLPTSLMVDERPGVSYPDGVQAPDGRIFIIYDHNRGDRHSLGKDREILMAVFTERDIEAGKPVDPRTRLRIVVNKVP